MDNNDFYITVLDEMADYYLKQFDEATSEEDKSMLSQKEQFVRSLRIIHKRGLDVCTRRTSKD